MAAAHDRRTVQVRDLAIGGRPCRLVWSKRIWRCREPLCPTATWTERRDDVARPRHGSAMHEVTDDGLPLVDDPARTAGVSSLGVDERSFLKASYLRKRRTTFVTGLVDLNRSRLLDIVPGRAGSAVTDWLEGRDDPWLSAVEKVALDPHRGYFNALVGGLDAPTVVVDAFHVVKLANTVVDEVRRRVQQEQTGHRGFKGDPLYGIRRILLTGAERLNDKWTSPRSAGSARRSGGGGPRCWPTSPPTGSATEGPRRSTVW
nr:transposase [Euzebya pacifica]